MKREITLWILSESTATTEVVAVGSSIGPIAAELNNNSFWRRKLLLDGKYLFSFSPSQSLSLW